MNWDCKGLAVTAGKSPSELGMAAADMKNLEIETAERPQDVTRRQLSQATHKATAMS